MSDVLSQEEIDRLLSALSQGEVNIEEVKKEGEEKKVRTYDFLRPQKFSKEQIRTVQMIHENFARSVSTYLSGKLRSFTSVNVVGIDQLTYDEYMKSISNPSFITIYTAREFVGSAIFNMSLEIFYGILDVLLGGPGEVADVKRVPTEIETGIIKKEIVNILTSLSQAWISIHPFIPVVESTETNPQFVQIVPSNEMVLAITFFVNFGKVEGYMSICWPSSVIEPIGEKLTTQSWFKIKQKEITKEHIDNLKENLQKTKLEVIAVIGETTLTLGEVLTLEVGDVIRLREHYTDPIRVEINGRTKFLGKPGQYKGNYAVKVTEVIEEGEEE
ncbi:MAG: flagellar motor switch protein FliM [Fervidobacterium sp.]|uniref:Flagellar motor switch protein FliM n=1 Tax=Fervidobacterium gondwanense DSM 13020 TaxID=1121883 RepID=A0A1M7RUX2_FERGO|nr:flagellar motor switch protein FliM [Fervidobacterium gondwanense]UXF01920.1 flagellar motor switch protein FliM [Fervidobacterium riparium]SHN50010.1 flagellar motor switch protein FliM [Fervidobacterium gondwanense DSM 13020]